MSDSSRNVLIITACEEVASGEKPNGEKWTLYGIAATDPVGTPIDRKFRSFEKLPVTGKPAEFEVTPFDKHGERTYTLARVGSSPGQRLGPKVDELRDRVDELEARVARLESGGSAPAAEEDIPF